MTLLDAKKWLMKLLSNAKKIFVLFIALFVLLAMVICIGDLAYFDFFTSKEEAINNLHSASLIALSVALLATAWINLSGLNKTSRSDFLLRIDNRYGSHEITQARIVIHKIHCKIKTKDICPEILKRKIGSEIIKMENDQKKSEDFIYILSFLDFLETIGYFVTDENISIKDIEELISPSICYYASIFEPFIAKRRADYSDPSYYCELEKLAKQLEHKKKTRIKCG